MGEPVQVEAARIPDRDRLLAELQESGLDARADGDAEEVADETFEHAEHVIMSIGAPFVPIKHKGTIYIRPPVG